MKNYISKDVLFATTIGLSLVTLPFTAVANTQTGEEATITQVLTPSYYWTYNPNIEAGDYNSPLTELKDLQGKVIASVPSHFTKRTPHMPHQQAFLFQPDQRPPQCCRQKGRFPENQINTQKSTFSTFFDYTSTALTCPLSKRMLN